MPKINRYMSMRQARHMLGDREKVVFKRSNMTIYIRKAGLATQVVLANTPIVTYTKNNTIRLRAGEWPSDTTKRRINQFISSHGYTLYQENFKWYIWDRLIDSRIEFAEGMELSA